MPPLWGIFRILFIFPRIEDRKNLNSVFAFEIKDFITFYIHLPNNEIDEAGLKEIANKLIIYQATPKELKIHRGLVRNTYKNN